MAAAQTKGFGFWTLTFLVVANMLGTRVFTTSGFTLASPRSPSLVLLAWLVGGLIALCGAFSYGLLVRRHPVSGGEYAFLSRAVHPAAILKLVFLGGFLAIGAWSAATSTWQEAALPAPGNADSMALAFAQALVWVSLSYSGFNAGVYVAGEVETPGVVSRALLSGTALVTALYLMLSATFVVAPPSAVIAGQADVAALAAQWIGGHSFELLIRVIIVLALFTSVLSMMMAGPRVYGRMAEDGLLPSVFIVRPDRTWPPVLLQTGMAVLLVLRGSVQTLLAYLGLTLSLCAAASVAGLFFGPHEYRVRGWSAFPPALFILATLVSGSLLVIRDPWQAAGTVVTLMIGSLAYRISRRLRKPGPF